MAVLRSEAEALFPLLTPTQLQELRARPRATVTPDPSRPLSTQLVGLERYAAACVFLSPEGTCTVYRFRPVVCRTYMVSTPPENCGPNDLPIAHLGDAGLVGIMPNHQNPDTGMLLDLLQELADR